MLIYPVVEGKGQRFFKQGVTANLQLAETRTFNTGVVAFIYQPAPVAQEETK